MSVSHGSSRYDHPAYGRRNLQFLRLFQQSMGPGQAADLAHAVKAYARCIDAKVDVFRLDSIS